ncbi:MAG: hypothetical protein K8T20_07040, partial [Planctomycetes bacterium]|nr:hypothetical protein [Planctomycetota bacterium]
PVYWKDRIFDDSPARQVLVVLGAAACGLVFFGDAVAWLFTCVIAGRPLSDFAPAHLTLVFDRAVTLVLAVGAGATTLGPERQQGTLPILLATGMPSRDILRGKFLAAIRSIAPVLVVAGAHLAFASLTMGIAGLSAALAFILGLASAFALACSLSLAAGHPRRAAVLTTGALFALWAVPSLFALPFPAHADFLTSLNPFGLLIRSVSLAGGHSAEPHPAGAVLFVVGSAAISVAALAAASAALESRVRA